jgi:drug/metabolite transporter (DMT)-like permease
VQILGKIPKQIYLWLAILIFGASSSITRKLTEIGAQNFMDERNPISLCNVLFVGNICALLVFLPIYRQQLVRRNWAQLTRQEWVGLILVAILAGALAPGLIFQALATTGVNNVVLLGRLEPPLTLALSIFFLGDIVSVWEIAGAIVAFVGVVLTIVLQPPTTEMMNMAGFHLSAGELLAALGAICLAVATIISRQKLARVPLGLYSIFRTAVGTVVFFITASALYGPHHFTDAFSPFLWQWMLVYGTLIVVVGQTFWVAGLRATTVSVSSLVASFTPIAAILFAFLILGEAPTTAQYIGGSVIIGGIVLSQIGIQRQSQRSKMSRGSSSQQQALENSIGFKGQ